MDIVFPEADYTGYLAEVDRNVYNGIKRPYIELTPWKKKIDCIAPLSMSPGLRDPKFRNGVIPIEDNGRKLGHIVLMSQIPVVSQDLLLSHDEVWLESYNQEVLDRQ